MRTSRWTGILRVLLFLWSLDPPPSQAIRWLSLLKAASLSGNSDARNVDQATACESLDGLNKKQVKICQRNVEVMDSVRTGAERAVRECQFQFQNRRWNCSTFSGARIFGKVLVDGTREAAFVHAISSAGVAHAVTRACSSGQLVRCGCDRTVRGISPEGFQWSGCSDNVAFGTAFSKSFVDARDLRAARGRASPRALMNLHNNEAGRKVVSTNMRVECKCHGVSGSCELKTCWRSMPPFRLVGTILKDKFDGASEVQPHSQPVQGSFSSSSSASQGPRRALQLVPQNPHFKPHTDTDLVYLDASPDFCDEDTTTGSLGTRFRPCNRTSKAIDGCELLCCGRGFTTRIERVRERCHCKFHWCCYVKCDECDRDVEVNTCQ